MTSKAEYVKSQRQTRNHECHWPGCTVQVPPAMWGCKPHWFKLPYNIRQQIWMTYRPGQEIAMDPSADYLEAAKAAQDWITSKQQPGKVVHLKRESFQVRIDRGTPWGNPFVIGKDGDRAEVIEKYRDWVTTSMDEKAQWIRDSVQELRGKTLGCWCAPQPCHGDILVMMSQ